MDMQGHHAAHGGVVGVFWLALVVNHAVRQTRQGNIAIAAMPEDLHAPVRLRIHLRGRESVDLRQMHNARAVFGIHRLEVVLTFRGGRVRKHVVT